MMKHLPIVSYYQDPKNAATDPISLEGDQVRLVVIVTHKKIPLLVCEQVG